VGASVKKYMGWNDPERAICAGRNYVKKKGPKSEMVQHEVWMVRPNRERRRAGRGVRKGTGGELRKDENKGEEEKVSHREQPVRRINQENLAYSAANQDFNRKEREDSVDTGSKGKLTAKEEE